MTGKANTPVTAIENTAIKQEPIDVEVTNWDNIVARFTPRKDKALKREAMHLDGEVPSNILQSWLTHYEPLNHDPPTAPSRGPQHYRRKRAEQVACDNARKAATKKHNQRVHAPATREAKPCYPFRNFHNTLGPHATAKERLEQQECRAQEHAKANANRCVVARMTTAPWTRVRPMARLEVPDSVWLEIGLYSTLTQILLLLQLSPVVYRALVPLLYRRIRVTSSAPGLIKALAANAYLPPLVWSLCMEDAAVRVDPVQWETILPQLTNLKNLVISPSVIPMPLHVIPVIRFRLVSFHAITSVTSNWVDFLGAAPCSTLVSLVLHQNFHGPIPSSRQLPRLSAIKAHPLIVARFAAHHARLTDAWFFRQQSLAPVTAQLRWKDIQKFTVTGSGSHLITIRISTADLLFLIAAAPGWVHALQHIVLDEDLSWSDFVLEGNDSGSLTRNALVDLALVLNLHFVSLRSIFLVCSEAHQGRAHRRLLQRRDARCFSRVMSTYASAFHLRSFHFSAIDGYVKVNCWGTLEEEWIYIDKGPEWDEVYSRPAVILGIDEYTSVFP
ncbi:hypothetical protein C8R45DRAFT_1112865 [Mycena sanguinolenta]|nr:hypothetical protein C8R45DRAFT_1112865 [Mycena sanguinolenta]